MLADKLRYKSQVLIQFLRHLFTSRFKMEYGRTRFRQIGKLGMGNLWKRLKKYARVPPSALRKFVRHKFVHMKIFASSVHNLEVLASLKVQIPLCLAHLLIRRAIVIKLKFLGF